ncbi:DNA polymerase-3 subunit epsilon [Vreelandella subterranea]|uniref:DNA polymerase-3 subunit epsilon n=1 Tax=Vreelandella subterranea TaxID=416874 RepID=A0A1H9SDL0_9GAMM|nr:DNA polymerase III subunit epsilon [Halomonas subterranea]SER83136.1 DNA polymerase-3 subunit epsilon [Halomonas subterranea]
MISRHYLDAPFAWFGGMLRRGSERRRYAASPYAWLFQPYLGNELVALACFAHHGVMSVAAVTLRQHQVLTSRAWVAALREDARGGSDAAERRHQLLYSVEATKPLNIESLRSLVEFIGNRPIIGWQLDQRLAPLEQALRDHLGFGLPNARVDVTRLHQRHLRRLHPQAEQEAELARALDCWQVPSKPPQQALEDATASALLYLRLQRNEVDTVS